MLMPPGKFFTMFHFLEYPFSRGFTHITSPNPYDAPDFDAGFMNVCATDPNSQVLVFCANQYIGQERHGAHGLGIHQIS
jgi:hypothetical protein